MMRLGCYINDGSCCTEIAFKTFFSKWKPYVITSCHENPGLSFTELFEGSKCDSEATIWKTVTQLVNDNILFSDSQNGRTVFKLTAMGEETWTLIKEIADFCHNNGYQEKGFDDLTGYVKKAFGSKWKSRIINIIFFDQRVTFNEIERSVKGISHKVLAESLKDMIEAGLVMKKPNVVNNIRITEYYLTNAGYEAAVITKKIADWAINNNLTTVFG